MTTKNQCHLCFGDFPEIIIRTHIQQCQIIFDQKNELKKKQQQLEIDYPKDWIFASGELALKNENNLIIAT